jgi:hypothetical protein
MFFHLFTLRSAHISGLVIVLSDNPWERIGKWETWPILKEERSLVCILAGVSVTKIVTLLRVSRATVSRLCLHTQIIVRQHRRRGTLTLTEEIVVHWGQFEKSQNCCRTGDSRTECHLEGPVSAKTVQHELHKSNIHGRAPIVKPVFTESNAQMRKQLCPVNDHKTWISDNWKRVWYGQMSCP